MSPRTLHLTPDHVALTRRVVERRPEDSGGWTELDEAGIADATAGIIAQRPPGPLWVFAYGSLIWKPIFEPLRHIPAAARGWHRAFCIELTSWRGTPDAPGLMMGLLPGGTCKGLAQEVAEDAVGDVVEALVRRETPFRELLPAQGWIRLDTGEGPLTALVYYAPPPEEDLRADLTLAETAAMIAQACGHAGSSAEYLQETVAALESHGIRDRHLWQLQRQVAEMIERTYPGASTLKGR
ncbi:MAG: gamma-glutamylcyclotransferase [Rhodobacteraceae bacterium]|nr:gamma-glutamylcyclotransferase [Paracoccaceae bacterium]